MVKYRGVASTLPRSMPTIGRHTVLATVLARCVCAKAWIERQNMDGGRRKHCQVELVGVEPLIVFFAAPLPCDTLGVHVVLLLGLLRPRKEKPTRTSALQAILVGATVEVQPRLDAARETCDTKLLPIDKPAVAPSCYTRTHHLGPNASELRTMVAIVFLILRQLGHLLVARSLSRLCADGLSGNGL